MNQLQGGDLPSPSSPEGNRKKLNPAKDLYRELRNRSPLELWEMIPQYNRASDHERSTQVGLIRAIGVVFAESGTVGEKELAREWLLGLLKDPSERVRRYAMAALPKLTAGSLEEAALVELLGKTDIEREKGFLAKALDKIGGEATLEALSGSLLPQTEQKVKANVARKKSPSAIQLDSSLANYAGLRIHLRGRRGLEKLVAEEVEEHFRLTGKFRVLDVAAGLVVVKPMKAFSLADIYSLRCFGSLGFVLGTLERSKNEIPVEGIASMIASDTSHRILETLTQGSLRYRLEFMRKGVSEGIVRAITSRAYALRPDVLNDSQQAPWALEIHFMRDVMTVELRPRLTPDPRLSYRQADIPAASHPPLAACMVRLAGRRGGEIVWDPFCGSGLELVERALLGGVERVFGTDRSKETIAIAQKNFAGANITGVHTNFASCDFRDYETVEGLEANSVTLLVTNPPLGKRIPIPNLRGMIEDLFKTASTVLRPGGRLVFANPLRVESPCPDIRLKYRQTVDFGGFNCRIEKYVKTGRVE